MKKQPRTVKNDFLHYRRRNNGNYELKELEAALN